MSVRLKPISEQVVVVTGASSGIGLATARLAAKKGATLVLVARSANALAELAREIESGGGRALAVPTDVTRPDEVRAVVDRAVEAFGGFDTWVNCAGTGVYGSMETVSIADMRAAFEANFWSLVYGSREAAAHLRARGGGAIVNLGSEVSERSVPLQGVYAATKHAVKGATEALLMELESEGAPVAVTLVKPAQIDTPFTVNAKNYLDSEPKHVPKVYAPEVVARAIVHAAAHPTRDVYVGGEAWFLSALGRFAPGFTDLFMERTIIPGTPSRRLPRRARDASGLEAASESLEERGNYPGKAATESLYTRAVLNPGVAAALAAAVGVAIYLGTRGAPPQPSHEPDAAAADASIVSTSTVVAIIGVEDVIGTG